MSSNAPTSLLQHIPPDGLPRCASRLIAPDSLSGAQLDDYLAGGWYRIGQNLSFCEFVSMAQGTFGVIWTRVPLQGYKAKKSSRRIMRRVERDFTVSIHPQQYDPEHEQLYQRYLTITSSARAPSLQNLCGGFGADNIFETWEISIRDGDELVGFSWFDLGEDSIESITGVYDPRLSSYGVGVYTMLREIEFARERGISHYYAGYILCGDPCMDYKLKPGHIQLLDRRDNTWRELESIQDLELLDPLARTTRALDVLRDLTSLPGATLHENPHFSLSAAAPNLRACLSYHQILQCAPAQGGVIHVVGWDTVTHDYELVRCIRASLTSPETGEVFLDDLLVTSKSLGHWESATATADALKQFAFP